MLQVRTEIEITAQILELASTVDGLAKTRIKLGASLASPQVNSYLKRLFEAHLIEYVPVSRTYRTTSRGQAFLHSLRRLCDMLRNDDTPLSSAQLHLSPFGH